MKTRKDEIKYLIYLKGLDIREKKKEIKELIYELRTLEGTKRLIKKKNNRR